MFRKISLFVISSMLTQPLWAESSYHFELPVSGSFGLGQMGNSKFHLKDRTMGAYSFEALPGIRVGKWMAGVHLDYRFQDQYSSVSSAGHTNLRGSGYLAGLGINYLYSPKFFIQGVVDFLGAYDLKKDSTSSQDDDLKNPLGFRVKAGYFFNENFPLSVDLDLQHVDYKKFHLAGHNYNASTTQTMVAVGLTYYFGKKSPERVIVQEKVETKPLPAQAKVEATPEPELKDLAAVTESDSEIRATLEGDLSFPSSSPLLKPEALLKMKSIAELLKSKYAGLKIIIEGHSDSSGIQSKNKILSDERAQSVKAALINEGIDGSLIEAIGFSDKRPKVSNEKPEGRAVNRRVEIVILKEKK